MEFSFSQYVELSDYAAALELAFLASAWDEPSLVFLVRVGIISIKIASACITDHNLLREARE